MLSAFMRELLKVNLYKPSQGKVARRATFIGLLLIFVTGSWAMVRDNVFGWAASIFGNSNPTMIIAALSLLLGGWLSYRLINFPPFADFLASVEAEMIKVSWPSKNELFSTTKVVLIFMGMFIAVVYLYDFTFDVLLSLVKSVMGR